MGATAEIKTPDPSRKRLFRSLSAGSDLDVLRLMAEERGAANGGRILSLVNLSATPPNPAASASPGLARRSFSNASPTVGVTASMQSINRLADSVENLRDKLSAHAGMQLFQKVIYYVRVTVCKVQ